MTLDSRGRLTVSGHAQRDVWRLEQLDPKAQVTVLADSYEGKRLNSPNDLVYKSNGDLYFTDPPYGLPTLDKDPTKQLQINGVYRIPGATSEARRGAGPGTLAATGNPQGTPPYPRATPPLSPPFPTQNPKKPRETLIRFPGP